MHDFTSTIIPKVDKKLKLKLRIIETTSHPINEKGKTAQQTFYPAHWEACILVGECPDIFQESDSEDEDDLAVAMEGQIGVV